MGVLELLTNPLFGVVTFLLGSILGFWLGHRERNKEWARREALIRETSGGCWVKAQIDAGNPIDAETPQ